MASASLQSLKPHFDVPVSTSPFGFSLNASQLPNLNAFQVLERLVSFISIKNPMLVKAFGFSLNASQLPNLNAFQVLERLAAASGCVRCR